MVELAFPLKNIRFYRWSPKIQNKLTTQLKMTSKTLLKVFLNDSDRDFWLDQRETSADGHIIVEVLHEIVVAFLSFLVQQIFRRILQIIRQIFVQDLTSPALDTLYCIFSESRL